MNVVLVNYIFNYPYKWKDGLNLPFTKPWMMTWGEQLSFILFIIPLTIMTKSFKIDITNKKASMMVIFRACSIPGIMNVIVKAVVNFALTMIPPSYVKSLSFFSVIFSTLMNTKERKLSMVSDWISLTVMFIGVSLTGVSLFYQYWDSDVKPTHIIIVSVIGLIIVELLKSWQIDMEHVILEMTDSEALLIHIFEGTWGLFVLTLVFMPLVAISEPDVNTLFYENTVDSLLQMSYSFSLPLTFCFIIIILSITSYLSIHYIQKTNTIKRAIIESTLPLIVWCMSLISHYTSGVNLVGESASLYSILEVTGFIVSFIGFMMYNNVITFTCLDPITE